MILLVFEFRGTVEKQMFRNRFSASHSIVQSTPVLCQKLLGDSLEKLLEVFDNFHGKCKIKMKLKSFAQKRILIIIRYKSGKRDHVRDLKLLTNF